MLVDRYYRDQPLRLLSQPEEAFVLDADNPYIMRRHAAAAASEHSGGVDQAHMALFGRRRDQIIAAGLKEGVFAAREHGYVSASRHRPEDWMVNNIRGSEQQPWLVCMSKPGDGQCASKSCLARFTRDQRTDSPRCDNHVQLLDFSYIYRELHPSAVFESMDGVFYYCVALDHAEKIAHVVKLADDTNKRTFPLEDTHVQFYGDEHARRPLANGASLVWGRAKVTRVFSGYGQYFEIPVRKCKGCNQEYAVNVEVCPDCKLRTKAIIQDSKPEYFDFTNAPGAKGGVFSITLDTIACRLELPADYDARLKGTAACPIREVQHSLREFVETKPPFVDTADLVQLTSIDEIAAPAVLNYFKDWAKKVPQWHNNPDREPLFPSVYGQCLHHALRAQLPEDAALKAFASISGMPVTADNRHTCRNCFGGSLVSAARTLERAVASAYPRIALGDLQDLGSVTYTLHPQTNSTTVVWYDAYEGGYGAAEKIFEQFESHIESVHETQSCECQSDGGCPLCLYTSGFNRQTYDMSKVGGANLARQLLGMPELIPSQPLLVPTKEAERYAQQAQNSMRAARDVPTPEQAQDQMHAIDPFELLRVQSHVHDAVLERIIDVRIDEIAAESPPVPLAVLQAAIREIRERIRPEDWQFPAEWSDHQVLHVLATASIKMTSKAHRAIALAVHPDLNPGTLERATRQMQRINEAWDRIKSKEPK
jgi:hypothetical protein